MAVTRGNWQTPLEVAQPPDDDLSQLPSQLPHQVWEDVSSGWRPGSLQREDPQLNFVSDGGDHVHQVSWQQSHHHSHHRQNSVSESRRTALEDNRTTAGMLRPVSEIPERYRSLFSQFPYFNIVQSTVFQDVFHSDRSVVVSAPTGSGKTVVMELALVRLLHTLEHQLQQQPSGYIQPRSRVVYCEYHINIHTDEYTH
nr:uncharacterized protein LOC128690842 [Cherax quadricarinatus]